MKILLLMRHAKSSWKATELADHERPLNKRGKKDAPLMGQVLKEHSLVPQQIISSTAIRARQTAETIAEISGFTGEISFLDRLYLAEAEEYLHTLKDIPDQTDRVMIIGHNPGLETLLQILSNKIESLPTAVIARINLPIEHWSDLSNDISGELVEIWRPQEIRKEEDKVKVKEEVKVKEKDKPKSKKKKGK
jgi:phosphohistidine phosphatase